MNVVADGYELPPGSEPSFCQCYWWLLTVVSRDVHICMNNINDGCDLPPGSEPS